MFIHSRELSTPDCAWWRNGQPGILSTPENYQPLIALGGETCSQEFYPLQRTISPWLCLVEKRAVRNFIHSRELSAPDCAWWRNGQPGILSNKQKNSQQNTNHCSNYNIGRISGKWDELSSRYTKRHSASMWSEGLLQSRNGSVLMWSDTINPLLLLLLWPTHLSMSSTSRWQLFNRIIDWCYEPDPSSPSIQKWATETYTPLPLPDNLFPNEALVTTSQARSQSSVQLAALSKVLQLKRERISCIYECYTPTSHHWGKVTNYETLLQRASWCCLTAEPWVQPQARLSRIFGGKWSGSVFFRFSTNAPQTFLYPSLTLYNLRIYQHY